MQFDWFADLFRVYSTNVNAEFKFMLRFEAIGSLKCVRSARKVRSMRRAGCRISRLLGRMIGAYKAMTECVFHRL